MSEQRSPELPQQMLENASKLTEDQGNSILKDLMTLLVQHTISGSIVQRDERVAEQEAFTQQLSAVTDKFASALVSQKAKTDYYYYYYYYYYYNFWLLLLLHDYIVL